MTAVLVIALAAMTAVAAWTTARWRLAERSAAEARRRATAGERPASRPATGGTRDPGPAVRAGALTGRSALIIDDDELGRQVLERMTAALGMRTMTAADGAGGLDVLDRLTEAGQTVDVVLLDLDVPELDGLAVSRAIRAHHPILPKVVLFTASTDADEALRADQAGVDGRLARPLRGRALHDVVTSVLGAQEPPDQQTTRERDDRGLLGPTHRLRAAADD